MDQYNIAIHFSNSFGVNVKLKEVAVSKSIEDDEQICKSSKAS